MKTTSPIKAPEEKAPAKWFVFGTFGTSILLHGMILFLISSVVIIQGVIPERTFEMIPPGDSASEESPVEEPAPIGTELPEESGAQTEASEEIAAPSFNVIATDIPSFHTFTSAPVSNFNGNIFASGIGSKGQGQGIAGGTGKGPRGMESLFGSKGASSDALVGYLYDIKQSENGKPLFEGNKEKISKEYFEILNRFVKSWNPSVLQTFFHSQDALSSYQFFMPLIAASAAPKAFGVENEVKPIFWIAHYKGVVVAPFTGRFRFAGQGDNILVVRFNDQVVLDACLGKPLDSLQRIKREPIGLTGDPQKRPMVAGEWIDVVEGQSYPMEVLLGEHGGLFSCYLLIQQENIKYSSQSDGVHPRLPVFQTHSTTVPKYRQLAEGPEIESRALVFGLQK